MCVLEFEKRESGDQFYHLEHYIEGHYIKYNSNSGFVDENARFTPQVKSFYNQLTVLKAEWSFIKSVGPPSRFKTVVFILGCHVEILICN